MKKVVAHGTFDIFHYGHLNYLEKAKSYGDYLIVLVTSDDMAKKHDKNPYFNEQTRMRIIKALSCVDEVILRKSNITNDLLESLKADVLITIDSKLQDRNIPVIVLQRTEGISSTKIKNHLIKEK